MTDKDDDHVSVGVRDLEQSRRFYDAVLRPLGVVRILDFEQHRVEAVCHAPPAPATR
jgi:catechol 2,3-dioxygenase-like lactoylglutathione lyase family enzyme